MGGAHGGADQEPSFLLSTQASSPQLTPHPFQPPFPSGTQGSGPPSKFQSPLPHQYLFPRPGMEAERPQEEEDGEQVSWVPGWGGQHREKPREDLETDGHRRLGKPWAH